MFSFKNSRPINIIGYHLFISFIIGWYSQIYKTQHYCGNSLCLFTLLKAKIKSSASNFIIGIMFKWMSVKDKYKTLLGIFKYLHLTSIKLQSIYQNLLNLFELPSTSNRTPHPAPLTHCFGIKVMLFAMKAGLNLEISVRYLYLESSNSVVIIWQLKIKWNYFYCCPWFPHHIKNSV